MAFCTLRDSTGQQQELIENLTLDETALRLRCSVKTIRRYIAFQGLPSIKVGRRVLVPRVPFDEWLRSKGQTF